MGTFLKRAGTVVVMGIPAWAVLVGLLQYQPSSLVVHVEEPGVRVWLGDRELPAGARDVGPIELEPGAYELRVTRGRDTLFSHPITLRRGHHKVVWAHWNLGDPAGVGTTVAAPRAGVVRAV